jgi:hypothetical protein
MGWHLMRKATGDAYPPKAAWAAHLIDQPYSPMGGRVPVVGIARELGTGAGFEMRPGPGRWCDVAERRVTELKAPDWAVEICHHIEMQVAAWMASSALTEVELVINREPCGEQVFAAVREVVSTRSRPTVVDLVEADVKRFPIVGPRQEHRSSAYHRTA